MSNAGSQIDTMLRHLGSGRDLQDFPGTADEKLALILTAAARGLIVWSTARGRFELTRIGLRPETPRRGSGRASLVVGTTVGTVIAAGALAAVWLPADASHHPDGQQASAPVSRPVDPGVPTPPQTASASPVLPPTASVSPVVPKVYNDQVPSAQHATPMGPAHPVSIAQPVIPTEPAQIAPKLQIDPVPTTLPDTPMEPARVAEQPVPAQPSATATPTRAKQAAVKKPRHQTAKVQKYRTWAGTNSHGTWAGTNSYRDERYVR
jgi:hypothetical protein